MKLLIILGNMFLCFFNRKLKINYQGKVCLIKYNWSGDATTRAFRRSKYKVVFALLFLSISSYSANWLDAVTYNHPRRKWSNKGKYTYTIPSNGNWSYVWRPSNPALATVTNEDGSITSFSDADLNGDGVVDENDIPPPTPDYGADIDGDGWADRLEPFIGGTVGVYDGDLNGGLGVLDKLNFDKMEMGANVYDQYTGELLGTVQLGTANDGTMKMGVGSADGEFIAFDDMNKNNYFIPIVDGSGSYSVGGYAGGYDNGQEYPSDGSNSSAGSGDTDSGSGSAGNLPPQSEVTNPVDNDDPDITPPDTIDNPDNDQQIELLNRLLVASNLQAQYLQGGNNIGEHMSKQLYNQTQKFGRTNDLLSEINNAANSNTDRIVDAINNSDSGGSEEGDSGEASTSEFVGHVESVVKSGIDGLKSDFDILPTVTTSNTTMASFSAISIGDQTINSFNIDMSEYSTILSAIRVILVVVIHYMALMKCLSYIGNIFQMGS